MSIPIEIGEITSGRKHNITNNSSVEINVTETTNWKLINVRLKPKEIIVKYESKIHATGQYFSLAELLELYQELEELNFSIEMISLKDELSQNLLLKTNHTNFRVVQKYEPAKDDFQVLEVKYLLSENISNRLMKWRKTSFGI